VAVAVTDVVAAVAVHVDAVVVSLAMMIAEFWKLGLSFAWVFVEDAFGNDGAGGVVEDAILPGLGGHPSLQPVRSRVRFVGLAVDEELGGLEDWETGASSMFEGFKQECSAHGWTQFILSYCTPEIYMWKLSYQICTQHVGFARYTENVRVQSVQLERVERVERRSI